MRRAVHRAVRATALVLAVAGPLLLTVGRPKPVAQRKPLVAAVPLQAPTAVAASLPPLFPVADAPAEVAADRPALVGVIGRVPDDAEVLVRGADGIVRTLRIGGAVDGWTLRAIGADRAIFARGARQHAATLPSLP